MNKALRTLLALTTMLAACTTENYEAGDGPYSYLRADFVEAHTTAEGIVDKATADDGTALQLQPTIKATWTVDQDTTYRARLYYNYNDADPTQAEPVMIAQVPVCRPQTMAVDSVKTDPVALQSIWQSANRRWLNLSIDLKTGSTSDNNALQSIAIAHTGNHTNADGTTVAHITLYHNQGNVPQYYSNRIYLSIPTQAIEADSANISITTYNGLYTTTLPLKAEK